MTVKIEKNVPLPPKPGRPPKYPWQEMEIGDSFLVNAARRHSISNCMTNAAKRTGFKFTSRKTPEGIRVWRFE